MKKIIAIALLLVSFSAHAQQLTPEFGLSYVYAKPMGGMAQSITRGHGASTYFGWIIPNQRFAFGLDFAVAEYGRDKSTQEYTMEDGGIAPMDIIVSNTFVNFSAYSRWYMTTEGLMRPYLTGALGYSHFNTSLNIYDPDELDHCTPVDSDVLYEDGTMIVSIGAGAKADFASAFKKMQRGRFFLEISMNFTQGGQVRYMNADAAPTKAHHHGTVTDGHVMADFTDTQTQIVHKHHVGYLFESPVQMMELRVGLSMAISRE